MMNLISMLQYDKWANDRTVAYMSESKLSDPRILSAFSHIVGAQKIWMERIKGKEHKKSEGERSLEDCKVLLQTNYDEYMEFLSWIQSDEVDSMVDYRDMQGKSWSNSLREIITHVCNHGTYHRGQIALLVRAEGDVPVATDYIVMMREGK